jgi:hypothetical protein
MDLLPKLAMKLPIQVSRINFFSSRARRDASNSGRFRNAVRVRILTNSIWTVEPGPTDVAELKMEPVIDVQGNTRGG